MSRDEVGNDVPWEDSIDERFGEVLEEHAPMTGQTFPSARVVVDRREWPDRVFYVLTAEGGGDLVGVDLDRAGWQQLRDLCDAVLTRMDEDTR